MYNSISYSVDSTRVSYEIYPNSPSPTFNRIGTVTIKGCSLERSALSSEYYACYEGPCFVVWKFVAELGISWFLDDPPFKVRRPNASVV